MTDRSKANQPAKLTLREREEVNSLIERAQDDLEGVIFELVAARNAAIARLELAGRKEGGG